MLEPFAAFLDNPRDRRIPRSDVPPRRSHRRAQHHDVFPARLTQAAKWTCSVRTGGARWQEPGLASMTVLLDIGEKSRSKGKAEAVATAVGWDACRAPAGAVIRHGRNPEELH